MEGVGGLMKIQLAVELLKRVVAVTVAFSAEKAGDDEAETDLVSEHPIGFHVQEVDTDATA